MKPKLLIVEDNDLTQAVVQALFDGLGFEVKVISNGAEVLPYLEDNQADVMILDLELPGMTGDEIFRRMIENPKLKDIPVVPFSAHTSCADSAIFSDPVVRKKANVIYTLKKSEESTDVNRQLVEAVVKHLKNLGKPLPEEVTAYLNKE